MATDRSVFIAALWLLIESIVFKLINLPSMEIKVGDTVELKSGGPVMTVNKLILSNSEKTNAGKEEQVECVWFDNENKTPIHHEFVKATLVLYAWNRNVE